MRKAEYDLFGYSTRSIPDHESKHDLYLDYERRLGNWIKAFGKDNLVLRIFDRKLLLHGDVVADFFSLLGISKFDKIDDKNVSLGLTETKLGHLIVSGDFSHKVAMMNLLRRCKGDYIKMTPSRESAMAFYGKYRESNARLNAVLDLNIDASLFQEDFSDYPEDSADVWSEDVVNELLLKLLEEFDKNFSALDADDLREAALAVGRTRPRTAVKLLKMAKAQRPDGLLIKRRLAEFEKIVALQVAPDVSDDI